MDNANATDVDDKADPPKYKYPKPPHREPYLKGIPWARRISSTALFIDVSHILTRETYFIVHSLE